MGSAVRTSPVPTGVGIVDIEEQESVGVEASGWAVSEDHTCQSGDRASSMHPVTHFVGVGHGLTHRGVFGRVRWAVLVGIGAPDCVGNCYGGVRDCHGVRFDCHRVRFDRK